MPKTILNRKKINPTIPTFTGTVQKENVRVQLFRYNSSECTENTNYKHQNFKGFEAGQYQNWLNISGLYNVETVQNICQKLNIHHLEIQDILDINQRPKFQEYENHLFCSLKSVLPIKNTEIEQEQLSFILGANFIVSFQEKTADYFDHIRQRLKNDIGIIRSQTPDYLLFVLIESILDNYFKTLHNIDAKIEKMGIINNDIKLTPNVLQTIERYKRQTHKIKQTIVPIKDFAIKIERERSNFILEKNIKYFYELKDLCLSLIDECEHIEVRLESYTNLFFSIQGHKMNQVMKTLTVVSTIFIPLTFIAGIYGMNFTNMPELSWKWGYLSVWVLIILVFIAMMVYFKRKRWY